MAIEWELIKCKVKDLKAHPKNPRILTKDQADHLQKSIDKFGLIDKPIVTRDLTIIGGHQRISILKKNNIKEIECWMPKEDLPQHDVDELNIRLNKNTGEWDWDKLANEWEASDLLEWGFSVEELLDGPLSDMEETSKEEVESEKCELCGHKLSKKGRK